MFSGSKASFLASSPPFPCPKPPFYGPNPHLEGPDPSFTSRSLSSGPTAPGDSPTRKAAWQRPSRRRVSGPRTANRIGGGGARLLTVPQQPIRGNIPGGQCVGEGPLRQPETESIAAGEVGPETRLSFDVVPKGSALRLSSLWPRPGAPLPALPPPSSGTPHLQGSHCRTESR